MDNGLTRDQMIHFVACNVLLGKEAFSYLLSRIYFISVSFGCVQVSSFFQAFWNVNVALVGSRLPTFRDNLSIPSASVQHRVRLQKSEGSSCYICAGVAQLVQPLVYGLDLRGFALQQEKKKGFSLLQNVRRNSGAHPPGAISQGLSDRGVRLTTPCSRLRLKCHGTHAETRFRLLAKRTSPFKSAGASLQSTTGSRGVRISSK